MEVKTLDDLKLKICGKRIVSIEPSEWSGVVHALGKNHGFLSLTLDDGTVLEIGNLFIREHQGGPKS